MIKTLLVYGTTEGHTARVADRIAGVLRAEGQEVETVEAGNADDEALRGCDAVVVASSIHAGQPNRGIADFVEAHLNALQERPSAYVQVSLSTADPRPEKQEEARSYADRFLEASGWAPDRIALVGGALPFTRYGFFKRLLMKYLAKEPFGITDTSRDYDFTDWDAVDDFARKFSDQSQRTASSDAFVEGGST